MRGGCRTFEVFQQRSDIDARRRWRTLRRVGGQVDADRAVVAPEPISRDALHVGQRRAFHAVTHLKVQAPVAERNRLADLHADAFRIGEALLPRVEPLPARTLDFFGAQRLFDGHCVQHRQHRHARFLDVLPGRQLHTGKPLPGVE